MTKTSPKTAEKKEEYTTEQIQQATAQALNKYFTDDVNEKIMAMSDEQMMDTLRRLEDSEYWFAMLRYANKRLLIAQSTVNNLDPVTQPTAISRAQGIMTGLTDLQNTVIQLVAMEQGAAENARQISSEYGS